MPNQRSPLAAEAHWQPHAIMIFIIVLDDVMAAARLAAGITQQPIRFDMAV